MRRYTPGACIRYGLLASFCGFFFLCGFHEDSGDDFRSFTGADSAGGLLLGSAGDEAVMEYTATGGAVMGAEGVVDLLGEFLAELGFFADGFAAEEDASCHDRAGERTAGTAGAAHAAAKARGGTQEAVGAFFAAAGQQGLENGLSAVEAAISVGFFCRFSGKGRILVGKGHMVYRDEAIVRMRNCVLEFS